MPKITRYQCPVCGEDYSTRSEAEECMDACRRRHGRVVREVVEYVCAVCGAEFLSQEYMTQHELACTGPAASLVGGVEEQPTAGQ